MKWFVIECPRTHIYHYIENAVLALTKDETSKSATQNSWASYTSMQQLAPASARIIKQMETEPMAGKCPGPIRHQLHRVSSNTVTEDTNKIKFHDLWELLKSPLNTEYLQNDP